ncbi:MAG: hypothetical protein JNM68_00850 [Dinghuibacter sp.]|nr:hypothetical protein [Dinghuibacter sp.]
MQTGKTGKKREKEFFRFILAVLPKMQVLRFFNTPFLAVIGRVDSSRFNCPWAVEVCVMVCVKCVSKNSGSKREKAIKTDTHQIKKVL